MAREPIATLADRGVEAAPRAVKRGFVAAPFAGVHVEFERKKG